MIGKTIDHSPVFTVLHLGPIQSRPGVVSMTWRVASCPITTGEPCRHMRLPMPSAIVTNAATERRPTLISRFPGVIFALFPRCPSRTLASFQNRKIHRIPYLTELTKKAVQGMYYDVSSGSRSSVGVLESAL